MLYVSWDVNSWARVQHKIHIHWSPKEQWWFHNIFDDWLIGVSPSMICVSVLPSIWTFVGITSRTPSDVMPSMMLIMILSQHLLNLTIFFGVFGFFWSIFWDLINWILLYCVECNSSCGCKLPWNCYYKLLWNDFKIWFFLCVHRQENIWENTLNQEWPWLIYGKFDIVYF